MLACMLSVEDDSTEDAEWCILKGLMVQAQDEIVWVWILVHPLTRSVALGKSLDIFDSLFLHLFNWDNNIGYFKGSLKRLSKLIYVSLQPGELPG